MVLYPSYLQSSLKIVVNSPSNVTFWFATLLCALLILDADLLSDHGSVEVFIESRIVFTLADAQRCVDVLSTVLTVTCVGTWREMWGVRCVGKGKNRKEAKNTDDNRKHPTRWPFEFAQQTENKVWIRIVSSMCRVSVEWVGLGGYVCVCSVCGQTFFRNCVCVCNKEWQRGWVVWMGSTFFSTL
jgi:hypothetical protein